MTDILKHYIELGRQLQSNNICMDNKKTFPVSLTPYFIENNRYNELGEKCERLLEAFEILTEEYLNNYEMKKRFPENKTLKKLECSRPKYNKLLQYARFDIIEDEKGNFKLLELNCACAGGILLTPTIKNILKTISYNQDILGSFKIIDQKIDEVSYFFNFLIDIYRSVGGTKTNPVIAYVNSNFDNLTSDLNQFLSIGKQLSLNVINVNTQDISCRDKKAYYKDQVIDIAHGKYGFAMDNKQFVRPFFYNKNFNEVDNYLEAIKNNYFTHINSFPSFWIGENKKLLALVQEKNFLSRLNSKQVRAIDDLLVETFLTAEADEKLINQVKKEKDQYVIKSCIDTRGKGVHIGRDFSSTIWEELVESTKNKPYIVQKFIPSKQNQVNVPQTDINISMNSTLGMYLVGGRYSGLLCRSSPNLKTNFYASGVFRPVYVIAN